MGIGKNKGKKGKGGKGKEIEGRDCHQYIVRIDAHGYHVTVSVVSVSSLRISPATGSSHAVELIFFNVS